MYLPQEIIRKKRNGEALAADEILDFAHGLTTNDWSDAQIAAMAMAIIFQGLGPHECTTLTLAMRDSGKTLQWDRSQLRGPLVDKHSTGGVGDNVSLILGPLVAACDHHVPMISGRGLGHTGGTLDKLEAIPGYNAFPSLDVFQKIVAEVGVAIIGQTDELAPADRRLYAIRDVTATVESTPLITASILSKKLAAGLDALVMDIKVGNGAFMTNLHDAQMLAQSIISVAALANMPTTALITDMNQSLAPACGNALELRCAIDYLKGITKPARLHEVTLALCAHMLQGGNSNPNLTQARDQAERALQRGDAADIFARMIHRLGGPADFVESPERYLSAAPVIKPVYSTGAGYISAMDTRALGLIVMSLGGGRRRVSDRIDPRVGISDLVAIGTKVDSSSPIALIHAATESDFLVAQEQLRCALSLSDSPSGTASPIIEPQVS